MGRALKAERYAEGVSPTFCRILTEGLPYWSFDKACQFYHAELPNLTQKETALLGCNDRYFLLTGLLNRVDAIHPWVYDRCREVEEDPDGFLDLWARMHFKSTVITFSGSIQEVLIDPNIRICILANSLEIARPFLEQIKNEFEMNDYLKEIYPDVLYEKPEKQSPRWSMDEGIVVKRTINPREATIEAHSIMKLPTGKHYPLLEYDDVITEANVTNPEQIAKATRQVELSRNLGIIGVTRRRFIGTRYSYADTYGELISKGILTPRLHPATEDGTLDGKPVLLSQEEWDNHKRDQRGTIAAQMLQRPEAGNENTFRLFWLASQGYMLRPAVMNVWIIGDPSAGKHKTSDRTAIVVIGMDTTGNFYLLDGYCHRMQQSQRWEKLHELFVKWSNFRGVQTVRVGWERYGMQEDIDYFEREMRKPNNRSFTVEELNWVGDAGGEGKRGLQSKKSRVGRLEPDFRLGNFYVPAKVWYEGETCIWGIECQMVADLDRTGAQRVDSNGNALMKPNEASAEIVYRPWQQTREEAAAVSKYQRQRTYEPIRRINEDGDPYDLTRVFFEEYALFPFASHDDLIDAMARVYDMEPLPATPIESKAAEPLDYPDS